jgi:hypothetical protein
MNAISTTDSRCQCADRLRWQSKLTENPGMKTIRPDVDGGPVVDAAPSGSEITDYDRKHLITYLRLLDAVRDGADRETIVRDVLKLAHGTSLERTERAYASHLTRAKWVTQQGYHLLFNDQMRNGRCDSVWLVG